VHGAVDDAAPDQNIGAALLEQASCFLFCLFSIFPFGTRGWPFHHAVNRKRLGPFEIFETGAQLLLLLLALVVLKMGDRYGEVSGGGDREWPQLFDEREEPLDAGKILYLPPVPPNETTCGKKDN